MDLTRHDVTVNGVRLAVATAGPQDAATLLLLHGWPESGRGWSALVPHLADRYFLVIPDQRGFGDSDRPEGTAAYHMGMLVGDVVGLAQWRDTGPVGVVGHDFGGAVSWALGAMVPDVVSRMVVMASPHPARFKQGAAGNVDQLYRAFYVWLMHAGEQGERLLAANDFQLLSDWAFGASPAMTEEVRAAYRAEWRRPGAFHAMAEWYRANYTPDLLNPEVPLALPPVRVAVRYLHGERDLAFTRGLETGSGAFVDAEFDEHVVAGTTHWMVHERPDEVGRLVAEWIG